LKRQILDLKGEVVNPLSDDELTNKFYGNCEPIVGREKCERLMESVWQFDKLTSLDELYHWGN
jgi:hypothetical protein